MTYTPIEHQEHETWQQAAQRFVDDLTRCEHGRHAGDACFDCEGSVSHGNPRQRGKDPRTDAGEQIVGFTLGGTHAYVLVSLEDYDRGHPIIRLVKT
jgi:hypothetical protein